MEDSDSDSFEDFCDSGDYFAPSCERPALEVLGREYPKIFGAQEVFDQMMKEMKQVCDLTNVSSQLMFTFLRVSYFI